MHSTRHEDCPNCECTCESISYDSEWSDRTGYDSETRHIYGFKCDECGCEFSRTVVEKTTVEEEDIEIEKEGTKECSECDGSGECQECGGEGTCPECDGEGVLKHGSADEHKCEECKGTGNCHQCSDGDGKCIECEGKGRV